MKGQREKVSFAKTSGTWSRALLLVALLGVSSALGAQQAKPPTLNEILERLEANLNHYDTRLPSLFCDEHAISRMWPGGPDQNTVTDSVFRLRRTPKPDHTTTLVESREIRTVNGRPATSQKIDGPTLLSGAFEGGLAVVSLDQSACMNYALEPINHKRWAGPKPDPYIVRFATALTPQNSAKCLLQEDSKGRAVIDPASMQIRRLEITTPYHTIVEEGPYTAPIVGKRVLTVDYAPVLLGGESFWLPSAIDMRTTSGSGFHQTDWTFEAAYRNYHKLEVTARILPDSEAPVQ
jgi:hypothetical protein